MLQYMYDFLSNFNSCRGFAKENIKNGSNVITVMVWPSGSLKERPCYMMDGR